MRDKAVNEVARPVSDNELDDNDEEEHYDIELPKSSFLNEKMALDAMKQMRLFEEERELKELSKMVLKNDNIFGGNVSEKKETVVYYRFFQ